jgi:hypothetical protein
MYTEVYSEEILTTLNNLPHKIQVAVKLKMENVLDILKDDLFSKKPGMFLDKSTVTTDVEDFYGSIIGSMAGRDKQGSYLITPTKQRALQFVAKSGDLVTTKLVRHPFLKTVPQIERVLLESKPWIIDQIEDTVIEAL